MAVFRKRTRTSGPAVTGESAGRQLPASTTTPDRISVWPLELGQVGIDITFLGAGGGDRAGELERALRSSGVPSTSRPEGSGAWSLRITVPRAAAGQVVARFLDSAN